METKKQKGIAPPRYDEAFKEGAIRMVTEQGRLSSDVAQELDICVDTLRSWLTNSCCFPSEQQRTGASQRRLVFKPDNSIVLTVSSKKSKNLKQNSNLSKNKSLKKTRSLIY